MKYRIFLCVIAVILIGFGILGIVTRQSFTDLSHEENYLELLQVAEIPGGTCITNCQRLAEALPEVPIVLRVSAVGELENLYAFSRQKVAVQEIYAGDGIAVGDEIYLISNSWGLILESDCQAIQRGFVNVLRVGVDYLVFISKQATTPLLPQDVPYYQLYSDDLIAPVFCYEESENTIVTPIGITTYVPYTKVKNNEFFVTTEERLQAWLNLKSELLLQYLSNAA